MHPFAACLRCCRREEEARRARCCSSISVDVRMCLFSAIQSRHGRKSVKPGWRIARPSGERKNSAAASEQAGLAPALQAASAQPSLRAALPCRGLCCCQEGDRVEKPLVRTHPPRFGRPPPEPRHTLPFAALHPVPCRPRWKTGRWRERGLSARACAGGRRKEKNPRSAHLPGDSIW